MGKREASEAGVIAGARHRFDQLLVKLPKARGITRARVTAYSFRTDVTAVTSEEWKRTRTVGSIKRRRVGRIELN